MRFQVSLLFSLNEEKNSENIIGLISNQTGGIVMKCDKNLL